jgi:hypothetical protein
VADLAAVQDAGIEAVGGGHRNAPIEGRLDDVVIGADLGRGDDQAVQGRVLHDLVDDLQLARDVVDRRFGAQHQEIDPEGLGGHQGPGVGRVEEAVARRVGDDGEGQLAVLRVEVLGAGGLLRGVLEAVAGGGLVDAAADLGLGRTRQSQRPRCGDGRQNFALH